MMAVVLPPTHRQNPVSLLRKYTNVSPSMLRMSDSLGTHGAAALHAPPPMQMRFVIFTGPPTMVSESRGAG